MSSNGSGESMQGTRRLEDAGHWLIRLQEDALSESEMSEWVEWCERDPKNLEVFEELRSVWQAVDHLPRDAKPLLHKRVPLWAALAASVVLAVIVGSAFYAMRYWPASERIANLTLVQTSIAENQRAILPDGSQLEVGGDSTVAVQYSEQIRKLQLRDGEAFFKVKHDVSRPFVVQAGDLQVVAVGTAFNIRRAGAHIAVTVEEGAVEVRRSSGDAMATGPGEAQLAEPMRVDAGYQLVVESRSGAAHASSIDPAVALAWRAGRLEFAGDTLGAVVDSVNRYAGQPIRLGDPQLAELTFTGTVFFDSIDAWLDSLQQVFPVKVERTANGEVVLLRRPQTPGQTHQP